jgi:Cofactor assembly of complex C subunit B
MHALTGKSGMHVLLPGLGSAALVLSIAAPFGGNLWYLITLISPAAGAYYLRKGDRQEEVSLLFTCASLCMAHCAMCVRESCPAAWQGMAAPLRAMLRAEHVLLQYKVKMVTADDEQTTDIITEGDVEETTRFCRVRRMHLCHRAWSPPLS